MNANIFDGLFNDAASVSNYRSWVLDDGEALPARLENWDPEDLAAYVGGQYTK